MSKIEFLEDVTVNDRSKTSFKKGQIIDLPEPSCIHWIKRGKAMYFQGEIKKDVKNPIEKSKEVKQDKELKQDKKV